MSETHNDNTTAREWPPDARKGGRIYRTTQRTCRSCGYQWYPKYQGRPPARPRCHCAKWDIDPAVWRKPKNAPKPIEPKAPTQRQVTVYARLYKDAAHKRVAGTYAYKSKEARDEAIRAAHQAGGSGRYITRELLEKWFGRKFVVNSETGEIMLPPAFKRGRPRKLTGGIKPSTT